MVDRASFRSLSLSRFRVGTVAASATYLDKIVAFKSQYYRISPMDLELEINIKGLARLLEEMGFKEVKVERVVLEAKMKMGWRKNIRAREGDSDKQGLCQYSLGRLNVFHHVRSGLCQ